MTLFRLPLQIIYYKEGDQWVAHCLQFDLVGVADTKQEAMRLLNEATWTQFEESLASKNFRNLFTPADSEYFQMFAAGTDVLEGELKLTIDLTPNIIIERTDVREFRQSFELISA